MNSETLSVLVGLAIVSLSLLAASFGAVLVACCLRRLQEMIQQEYTCPVLDNWAKYLGTKRRPLESNKRLRRRLLRRFSVMRKPAGSDNG